jgi:small subunit ribosomal protein S10
VAEGFGLLNQRTIFLYHGFESHFLRCLCFCGDVLQLAECMLCTHKVTGSNPVVSTAFVAQLAEHSYGKGKVPGSIPAVGCKNIILMHITLVLRSYDRSSLTKAVKLLCFLGHSLQTKTCQTWALSLHPLPTKVKKYTLLRSPHIDKKSREQIELKTYQKAIHIKNIQDKKTFLGFLHLVKLVHLDGVQCKCTFEAHTSL